MLDENTNTHNRLTRNYKELSMRKYMTGQKSHHVIKGQTQLNQKGSLRSAEKHNRVMNEAEEFCYPNELTISYRSF